MTKLNKEEMEVVEINEVDSSDNRSGAAMPDIQGLLRAGVIKVNPETGLPDTPENPVKQRLVRVRKASGVIEERVENIYGGHVMDPDVPGWRVSLNPELYYSYLEMERETMLKGRRENIAPVLMESEFESFKEWLLENKGIDMEEEDIAIPEIAEEVSVRKKAASKKRAAKKIEKAPVKKKEVKKEPEVKKEVVEEDDDLSDL